MRWTQLKFFAPPPFFGIQRKKAAAQRTVRAPCAAFLAAHGLASHSTRELRLLGHLAAHTHETHAQQGM